MGDLSPAGLAATVAASFVELDAPHGPAWEFLVLFAVVVAGPHLVSRARVPGIAGLLLGGFAVGPHGLGLITAQDRMIPEIGHVGLLYLVFAAGVELDLGYLRGRRRAAAGFGSLAFGLPALAGAGIGLALGWGPVAALLLGSLLGSQSLIAYPAVREAHLAEDPAVATVVGSTAITDALALGVLAIVAALETSGAPAPTTGGRLVVGLAVVAAFTFGLLPRAACWCLRTLGTDRAVRCLVAVCGFLSAASLAEAFGVEGVIGAFLAGLALNPMVPDGGPLRQHIEFFGSAVFVPVFLVSAGLILDPSVLAEGETLAYAAVIVAACLGGKAAAVAVAARACGFTRAQAGLMFGLAAPQAAATLAATIVGYEIGLFSTAVVNAVLVLILVSVVAGTVATARAARLAPRPAEPERRLGDRVLLAVDRTDPPAAAFAVAAALAAPDGGAVDTVLVVGAGGEVPGPSVVGGLAARAASAGVDGEAEVRVDRSLPHAVISAAVSRRASAVVVYDPDLDAVTFSAAWVDAVARALPIPVVLVCGTGRVDALRGARLVASPGDDFCPGGLQLAAEVAARLGLRCRRRSPGARPTAPDRAAAPGAAAPTAPGTAASSPAGGGVPVGGPAGALGSDIRERGGEVTVVPVAGWDRLAGVTPPGDGSILVVVPPLAPLVPALPAPATAGVPAPAPPTPGPGAVPASA